MNDRPMENVHAVLYAAKSGPDERGSIPDQLRDCREAAEAEGRLIVGEGQDENFSAFRRSRGPGLERAVELALDAAREHGQAELWAQHSDRFARGDGRKARHLGKLYFDLLEADVELRSVQDDDNLRDAIRAVLIGERNSEDSARKALAVQSGKRRAAERGDWTGGIPPDGYRVLRDVNERGDVMRRVELDPDRKAIYDLLWSLARAGYSVRAITHELDRRGFLTNPYKKGRVPRPFDGNRVRQTLDNVFYAGLKAYRGEIVAVGNWPTYVTPEDFQRLRDERRARSRTELRKPGRPPERYLLAGVARCGCGSRTDVVTGNYVRKDGTRARRYTCAVHRERPWECSAEPFDATVVDKAFLERLDAMIGDLRSWRDALVRGHEVELERLNREADRACVDLREAERIANLMQAQYEREIAAGNSAAEAILEPMRKKQRDRQQAQRRLEAALDALHAAIEGPPERDPLRASFDGLLADLEGRVSEANGIAKALNLVVREFFSDVFLHHRDDGSILITPRFSAEAAERIRRKERRPPPLSEWHNQARANLMRIPMITVKGDERLGENPPPPW